MAAPTDAGPVQVVLLAGPSGSGKSRIGAQAGHAHVVLDDFYLDADHPDLPRSRGVVDWDDPRSWDGEAALAALTTLAARHRASVPVYDIAASRRAGWHEVSLRGRDRLIVAEGIFAPELVGPARSAGLSVTALYLDRPRTMTALFRFARDIREHRKSASVLLRRGAALWRAEPAIRTRAIAAGCRPVSPREALEIVTEAGRLPG